MGIDALKRWHWIIVGIVVGLLLALTRSNMEPTAGRRSTKSPQFEADLVSPPVSEGKYPRIKDLVVYPPIDGVYPVEFKLLSATDDGRGWSYRDYSMIAETPYKATIDRPSSTAGETILTHLDRLSKKYPTIKYEYAWWDEPKWMYVTWTVGSVVVIGGIWPTILSLMIGAGLGPKHEKDDYDLDRFGKEEDPAMAGAAKTGSGPTAEQHEQLAAMQATLEKSVGDFGNQASASGQQAGQSGQPVRKLDGGPVETVAVEEQKEDKEYAGEFYPTARVKKPQDE